MFCVKKKANTQTGFKRSVFKLICGGFWKTPLFYSSDSWFWWEYVAISILFCPRPSLALCSFFSSKSDVSLEETLCFDGQYIPSWTELFPACVLPAWGMRVVPCVSICKTCSRLFSHTEEFPFVAVLERTEGLLVQGPGSWGITWKLWVLWPFIPLGVIGHNFGM